MLREHSPNPGTGMVSLARGQGDHEAMSNHSGSTARHRSGDRIGTPNSIKSRVRKGANRVMHGTVIFEPRNVKI